MLPAWNMLHLIKLQPHHAVHHNSNQTSAQMLILQFSRQLHSRQHSSMFRWGRRGFPDGTSGWWTLDFQGNTWKDNMYSWAWSTTWPMSITMPLHEWLDELLRGLFGFKWHFELWGLYGHIQWWRHTREGKKCHTDTGLWFDLNSIWFIQLSIILNILNSLSSLKEHCTYNLSLYFPFIYLINLHCNNSYCYTCWYVTL